MRVASSAILTSVPVPMLIQRGPRKCLRDLHGALHCVGLCPESVNLVGLCRLKDADEDYGVGEITVVQCQPAVGRAEIFQRRPMGLVLINSDRLSTP